MNRQTEAEVINAMAEVSDALGGAAVCCMTRQFDVSIDDGGHVIMCRWEDSPDDSECPGQRKGRAD